MGLNFEWDARKARSKLAKHAVSFEEASTVFNDPNSLTIPDPLHSLSEARFVILGQSYRGKLMVVVHTERAKISASSVPEEPIEKKDEPMKKISKSGDEMSSHYDFFKGVRGKYAKRYAKGSNVVVLDPDVAKLFSTSKVVNRALRGLALDPVVARLAFK